MKTICSTLVLCGIMTVFLVSPAAAKQQKYEVSLYDCSQGKPDRTDYLWYRYPTKQKPYRDKKDNGKVHLIWEDVGQAHSVRIKVTRKGKFIKNVITDDDAQVVIGGLKNGKRYTFKLQGISNCGKGPWSKSLKVYP